jgi:hypothetical protein
MANQSEPFGWSLTSSCKVFPVSRDGTIAGWRIRLLKLKRKGGRKSKVKGQEKKSRQYESQILAENAMFEFGKILNLPNLKSNWITGNSPCFHRPFAWSLLLLRAGTSNK